MPTEEYTQSSVATRQLVCAYIMLMPLVYAGVVVGLTLGGILPDEGFGEMEVQLAQLLALALLVPGVGAILGSFVLKKKLLEDVTTMGTSPGRRFKAVLIAMALSESGAVFGLILVLLTGQFIYGALLGGLSFAGTCFHFPSRAWLAGEEHT